MPGWYLSRLKVLIFLGTAPQDCTMAHFLDSCLIHYEPLKSHKLILQEIDQLINHLERKHKILPLQ